MTDLRHKTSKVLKKAKEEGYVFLVRHSKTEAAMIDIALLKALQEAYEDYLDILEFDKTVGLKSMEFEFDANLSLHEG